MLRRAGLIATLLAGAGLFGASLHGMTGVDRELQLAAATPAPRPELVREFKGHGCDKPQPERRHPEV